jgi:hypothetical protein
MEPLRTSADILCFKIFTEKKAQKAYTLTGCMPIKHLFLDYAGNSGRGKTDCFQASKSSAIIPLCIDNGL